MNWTTVELTQDEITVMDEALCHFMNYLHEFDLPRGDVDALQRRIMRLKETV